MFLMDTQDFRKHSDYGVAVTEDDFLAVLTAAGVSLKDKPLNLRFRIKDMDSRMILAKFDALGENEDDFRVNIYLPGCALSDFDKIIKGGADEFLKALNHQISHVAKGISQTRTGEAMGWDTEEIATAAHNFAKENTCPVVTALTPKPDSEKPASDSETPSVNPVMPEQPGPSDQS